MRDALASDAPAQRRVAQALVLALCRQEGCAVPPPPSDSAASPADAESDADAVVQLRAWPRAPPSRRALADGRWEIFGDDLSEGAERLPVPWCNATADGEVPPPFLYARHCVSFDRAVDWGAPPRAAPPGRADEQCAAVARGMQVALPLILTQALILEPQP